MEGGVAGVDLFDVVETSQLWVEYVGVRYNFSFKVLLWNDLSTCEACVVLFGLFNQQIVGFCHFGL